MYDCVFSMHLVNYIVACFTLKKAVKEYFRKEEKNKKRVLPECQELELGSDDKVSLVVQTMSGPGWALTVTKKEVNSAYTMGIMYYVCNMYQAHTQESQKGDIDYTRTFSKCSQLFLAFSYNWSLG